MQVPGTLNASPWDFKRGRISKRETSRAIDLALSALGCRSRATCAVWIRELDQDLGPERYDERRTSRLLEHAASLQDSSVPADSQNSVLREPVRSAQFGSQCTLPISHPDGGASWFRLLSSYLTCLFWVGYMGDSVACVPAFSRAGSG